jgi:CRP-like cAMP-binding protein
LRTKFASSFKAKSFGPGTAFGEFGLMEGARRTASVVTEEDTHFVVLTKEDYDQTLAKYHEQIYREKIEFLKGLIYFSDWNLTKLSTLLMITEQKTFQKNNYIYEEGDLPDYLYFIKEGEIEVHKWN